MYICVYMVVVGYHFRVMRKGMVRRTVTYLPKGEAGQVMLTSGGEVFQTEALI